MLNVVLDTNVVLDWLLFADAALNPLPARIAAGRVRVWTHARAVEELRRVLGYPRLAIDVARQGAILESYRAQTTILAPRHSVVSSAPAPAPRHPTPPTAPARGPPHPIVSTAPELPGHREAQGALPKGFPRCRDADDDHFLQLAYDCRADALVSRDRAILRLAKRAAAFGVTILTVRELVAKIQQEPLAL